MRKSSSPVYARRMIDEPASAQPTAVDPLAARLDRPLTEMTVDELMALKAEFEARGILVYNSPSPEQALASRGSGHLFEGVHGDLGKP